MTKSLHPLQALAASMVVFNLVTFSVFVAPVLTEWLGFVLAFSVAETTFITAALLLMSFKPRAVPKVLDLGIEDEERVELYCALCNIYVHPGTKHCGKCRCCVDHFDHHCKWLNTCIGGKNYRLFICVLVTLELATVVLLTSEALALQELSDLLSFLFVLADLVCNCGIFGLVSGLLLFHGYLKAKGMTTYDFVVKKRIQSTARDSVETLQKAASVVPEVSDQVFTDSNK